MKKIIKINGERITCAPKKKLHVAAYCRVSTDSEEQLESLDAQKKHYEDHISKHDDWELAGIYYDEGRTGTSKDKRPGLLRMIGDCEAGKIDFIITKSISRFVRNTADCLELVRRLLELDIPIFFEKENLNTASMESEFFLAVLSSMAEGESSSISQNNKWSVRKRFSSGTYKLSSPPYGYNWDGNNLKIDPEQAEVVKWIFAQVLSGKGAQAIANELNLKGIPAKKGGHWTSATILGMIGNEKYTGDAAFQKTYTDSNFNRHANSGQEDMYIMSEHHEAIISHDDFRTAAKVIERHSKEKGIVRGSGKYRKRYSLSGKIICGECGGGFKRRIHTCAGYKYTAWCCKNHIADKKKCSMKFVRDDEIKSAFVTMMNKLVFARRLILRPYVSSLKLTGNDASLSRIQELQTLLMQNSEQRETLTKLMAQGYIDRALYNSENAAMLSEAESYRTEINILNREISGEAGYIAAASAILKFAEKGIMLDAFDDELFENTVSRIIVNLRDEITFELKCGLNLTERI